jgi:hypothetical protein
LENLNPDFLSISFNKINSFNTGKAVYIKVLILVLSIILQVIFFNKLQIFARIDKSSKTRIRQERGNPAFFACFKRFNLPTLFFILGHVSGGCVTVTDGNCRIYLQL